MATVNSYDNPFTEIDDPVAVQGRLQGLKSHFVCVAKSDSDRSGIRIRIDDKVNPGFWAEVILTRDAIEQLLAGEWQLHASDFRYA